MMDPPGPAPGHGRPKKIIRDPCLKDGFPPKNGSSSSFFHRFFRWFPASSTCLRPGRSGRLGVSHRCALRVIKTTLKTPENGS